MQQMFWIGIALIAIIIGILVSLHLLDQLLRKKQAATAPEGEVGTAVGRQLSATQTGPVPLVEQHDASPRQRVLDAYRHLYKHAPSMAIPPAPAQTAADWLGSLGAALPSIHIFDRACYFDATISDSDADAFVAETRRLAERDTTADSV
jgi:hypothetical protein